MKDLPQRAIIIGGGLSIKEGIKKGLWDKIESKFTIALNDAYKDLNATFMIFIDYEYYKKESEDLKNLPLIIGRSTNASINFHDNTILLPISRSYTRDLRDGVYKSLAGLFALSLMIYLMDKGEIYLIGFDGGVITDEKDEKGRKITHYYQGNEKRKHGGIGNDSYYRISHRRKLDYKVYENERRVRIFNVSPKSNIPNLKKITYNEFFRRLNNKNKYCQKCIRKKIRKKVKKLRERIG